MAKKLTPISIRNVKPRSERMEIPDGGCNGLYLIVQPSGAKSWALRYRFDRAPKKLTLGPLMESDGDPKDEPRNVALGMPLTLKAARRLATAELHKIDQDIDPAAAKKGDKAASLDRATQRQRDTVDAIARQFLDRHARQHTKSWAATGQLLGLKIDPEDRAGKLWVKTGGGVLAKWSGRPITDISRRNVIGLLDEIYDRPAPITANRTLAAVRKMFNWSLSRDIITASPCAGVQPPGKETSRDRILADAEIVSLWQASAELGETYAPFIRALLLTGQRLREVAGMRWSEIDQKAKTWTIPGERTKNAQTHIVPLSRQAQAIIEAAPRIADSDFIFSTTGEGPINGFSKLKGRLDGKLKFAEHWTFHDARRSVASGLQGLGFSTEIIERALNHKSGAFKGVAGVYQKNPLSDEKRAALQAWADHVDRLVNGKTATVVPMRRRKGR